MFSRKWRATAIKDSENGEGTALHTPETHVLTRGPVTLGEALRLNEVRTLRADICVSHI
jgi:hypothetical protein